MKLSDIFERKRVVGTKKERRFCTALKGTKGRTVVSAFGATQEEADEALLELIRWRFLGSFTPLCLSFRGTSLIAWRDGDQWKQGRLAGQCKPVAVTWDTGWTSREQVERAMRLHLAQREWDEQEETSEILVDPDDQAWFLDWSRQQKAFHAKYRRLRAAGWTSQEAVDLLKGYQPDTARVEILGNPAHLLHQKEPQ